MVPTDGTPLDDDSPQEEPNRSTEDESNEQQVPEQHQTGDEQQDAGEETSTAVAEVRKEPKTQRPRGQRGIDQAVMEFQPDVVELEHRKVPGGARWTLYVCISLVVATVGWAWWAQVDRIVVARGELIPAESPVLIQPLDTAKVMELHAGFDEIVKPGDLLVSLDPTYSEAQVEQLESQRESLEARVARLAAELQNQEQFDISGHEDLRNWQLERQMFNERKSKLEAELDQLEAEREKILSQQESNEQTIEARKRVVAIMEKRVETDKKLREDRTVSERELQDTIVRYEDANLQLRLAQNKRAEFNGDLNVNKEQRKTLIAQTRAQISDELVKAQQELNNVQEELKKARRSHELAELRVPAKYGDVNFRVLERANLSRGSVAKPGDPIYKLMPLDTELEVEIKIQGRDIARIRADRGGNPADPEKKGDTVRVKLASFPYQKHGTLDGRIRAISEGTFPEGQGPAKQMVYRGRVKLLTTELEKVPDDFRLVPGMACTAEIKIGKRRVLEYFLYPLFRWLDQSLREP